MISKKNKILKENQGKGAFKSKIIQYYAIGENGKGQAFIKDVNSRFRTDAMAEIKEWATTNNLVLSYVGTYK